MYGIMAKLTGRGIAGHVYDRSGFKFGEEEWSKYQ